MTRAIWPSVESLQGDATSSFHSTWNDVIANLFFVINGEGVCLSFTGKRSPTQTMYVSATQTPIETKNPRVNLLVTKWQHVWLLALDRRRKLNDAMDRLEEVIKHKPVLTIIGRTIFLQSCTSLVVHITFLIVYISCSVEGICQL